VRYRGYELRRATHCNRNPQPLSWKCVCIYLPRTCHIAPSLRLFVPNCLTGIDVSCFPRCPLTSLCFSHGCYSCTPAHVFKHMCACECVLNVLQCSTPSGICLVRAERMAVLKLASNRRSRSRYRWILFFKLL
jgi:hypothetical protein